MTELELLKAARAVIAAQPSVTRGAFARDAQGRECNAVGNPLAVRFCAVGALRVAAPSDMIYTHDDNYWTARDYLNRAAQELGYGGIVRLNDSRGRTGVLACYDAAIAELEATA